MVNIRILVEGQGDQVFLKWICMKITYGFPDTTFEVKDHLPKSKLLSKETLLFHTRELLDDHNLVVFFIPDLHPTNNPFPHDNLKILRSQIMHLINPYFSKDEIKLIQNRIHIHVFKYNFEVIFLAELQKIFDYYEIEDDDFRNHIFSQYNHTLPEDQENYDFTHSAMEKNIMNQIFEKIKGKSYTAIAIKEFLTNKGLSLPNLTEKLPHFKAFMKDLWKYGDRIPEYLLES